jgi:hypothetical protein
MIRERGQSHPILLMLVPLANLIVAIMLWVNVLKALGRGPVMVLVLLFFGFIYLPYLAFSGDKRLMPAMTSASLR